MIRKRNEKKLFKEMKESLETHTNPWAKKARVKSLTLHDIHYMLECVSYLLII